MAGCSWLQTEFFAEKAVVGKFLSYAPADQVLDLPICNRNQVLRVALLLNDESIAAFEIVESQRAGLVSHGAGKGEACVYLGRNMYGHWQYQPLGSGGDERDAAIPQAKGNAR